MVALPPRLHILALLLMPRGLEGSQGLTLRELLFCGTSKGQGPVELSSLHRDKAKGSLFRASWAHSLST